MKKLRLEDLEVTPFETALAGPLFRGTVAGHAKPTLQYYTCACGETDPNRDCILGCSRESACPDNCVVYSDVDCLAGAGDVTA
ncbi:MAG TPA: hypothetical protein VHG08_21565 [Longimicrobium sp.]|nr:hypothetical protein [Longimicrobium sp.]